jgi:phage/plasmid-like protein (TIGR03299 family)
MTRTDKMDEFRANRFSQIANLSERVAELEAARERGELRKLADGRYQVLRSDTGMGAWDAGEILSEQGMPEHGLDLRQDGVTPAFYSTNAKPWHGLGTHLEEGLYSAKAACMAAGQDWEILKRRARFLDEDEDSDGNPLDLSDDNPLRLGEDDMWMTVRSDTRRALGQVGKLWTSIHNVKAFQFMEEFGQPFETVGSFRGGKRVFATMELPEDMTVDAEGVNEIIKLYVAAINHHDGNGGLKLYVTPYRVECGNTERLAVKGAVTSWTIKHTPNYEKMLGEAEKSLRLTHRYAENWTKEENLLARRDVTDKEVAGVLADIWGVDDESGTQKTNNQVARVMDIMNRWEVERERCGRTAYALERSLTGHADHAGDRRPRGENKIQTPLALLGQAILEDTQKDLKNTMHRRVMELVRK